MPIYEFECSSCKAITVDLCPIGTTANRCTECGSFATLVISLPAMHKILPGSSVSQDTSRGFSAPSSCSQAVSSEDDKSIRVYDFEFGNYERDKLAKLVDKERQSAVSDSYSI
jgi:hypothetical protein